jgi:hypothetical protein
MAEGKTRGGQPSGHLTGRAGVDLHKVNTCAGSRRTHASAETTRASNGRLTDSGTGRGRTWARRRSPDHGRVTTRNKMGKDKGSAGRRGAGTDRTCRPPMPDSTPRRRHGRAPGGDRTQKGSRRSQFARTNSKASLKLTQRASGPIYFTVLLAVPQTTD